METRSRLVLVAAVAALALSTTTGCTAPTGESVGTTSDNLVVVKARQDVRELRAAILAIDPQTEALSSGLARFSSPEVDAARQALFGALAALDAGTERMARRVGVEETKESGDLATLDFETTVEPTPLPELATAVDQQGAQVQAELAAFGAAVERQLAEQRLALEDVANAQAAQREAQLALRAADERDRANVARLLTRIDGITASIRVEVRRDRAGFAAFEAVVARASWAASTIEQNVLSCLPSEALRP